MTIPGQDFSQLLPLLQLLQGGGGSNIQPVSGLDQPVPLSGLPLGEQGFGLGGGGSLLGVAPGGPGGAPGGPGLDFFQLLSQLQGGDQVGGPSPFSLGQAPGIGGAGGFGAGGRLQPPQGTPGPFPTQAGLGGGTGLNDLLTLFRLGKTVADLPGRTASPTTPSGTLDGFSESLAAQGLPEFPAGAAGTQAFGGTFTAGGNLIPGSFGSIGATPGAELSAQLGARGLGDVPATGVGGGTGAAGIGLGEVAGAIGPALFAGTQIAQRGTAGIPNALAGPLLGPVGDVASGLPSGAQIGLGLAFPPLGALLGLDALLGGGPSFDYRHFPGRLAATLDIEQQASRGLASGLQKATSLQDVLNDIAQFKQTVGTRVGGFGAGTGPFDIPYLPGATGTRHEGGLTADFGPTVTALQRAVRQLQTRFGGV